MNSVTHSPGPWRTNNFGFVYAPDDEFHETLVARVGAFQDKELLPFSRERWTADANLIAAAPEMLASLIATEAIGEHAVLCGTCKNRDGDDDFCTEWSALYDAAEDMRQAAIAKAEGRS